MKLAKKYEGGKAKDIKSYSPKLIRKLEKAHAGLNMDMEGAFNLNYSCELNIPELITWVHLGCGTQEKHHAQPIKINIKLIFLAPPLATETDNINNTICYAEIVRLVQKLSQENSFNLIEHLAAQIYNVIYQNFIEPKSEKIFLNVTITKLKSPVSGVHSGVSFSYSGQSTV